jgi:hypothetical protein
VRQNKKLMAGLAAAVAVATLAGTSAFAESRPQRGTRGSGGTIRRDAGATRSTGQRGNSSVTRGERRGSGDTSARRGDATVRRNGNDGVRPRGGDASVRRGDNGGTRSGSDVTVRGRDESRVNRDRSTYESDRNRGSQQRSGREESFRRGGDSRNNRYNSDSRNRNSQPYHTRGRISRTQRYSDGYRVWVVGSQYPFYIPSRYWHRDRFRIGLSISLGGWYNPLGYYEYYDGYRDGYYDSRYDDRRSYTRGELRGVVESVDSRRTSFVLRNEDTGSFVTVLPRGRRVYVRPGEFVEVDGTWTRNGYFTAYDIDWPDRDRFNDRDDDDRYEEDRY